MSETIELGLAKWVNVLPFYLEAYKNGGARPSEVRKDLNRMAEMADRYVNAVEKIRKFRATHGATLPNGILELFQEIEEGEQ